MLVINFELTSEKKRKFVHCRVSLCVIRLKWSSLDFFSISVKTSIQPTQSQFYIFILVDI